MDEESMDKLRENISESIENYFSEYDWDNAFVKFFGRE